MVFSNPWEFENYEMEGTHETMMFQANGERLAQRVHFDLSKLLANKSL